MKTKKELFYLIAIGVVALAAVCILIIGLTRPQKKADPVPAPLPSAAPVSKVVYKEVEKLVEVEKTVTVGCLQDGLRDMGKLVTQEYYCTDVLSFSSAKKLFKTDITLKFTETSYLVSYDGTAFAGIDFGGISVAKDDDAKIITVSLPKAEILDVSVDYDSFVLYSEKSGLGNPLSIEDVNTSLSELENGIRSKALERGVLDRADENAKKIIRNFVGGLVDLNEYTLQYI